MDFGKRADEHATHRWSLFVRGPNDEDLSCFIAKVIFHLHPSFPNPVRELTSMPYELHETGWGEFELSIDLVFRDAEEAGVTLHHQLKLYPPGPPQPLSTKKPVVSERYDEIVFTNPTEVFYKQLMMCVPPSKSSTTILNPNAEHYTLFDDERDVTVLTSIHDHLAQELDIAKNRLLQLDGELALYHDLIHSAKLLHPASMTLSSSSAINSNNMNMNNVSSSASSASSSNSMMMINDPKSSSASSNSNNKAKNMNRTKKAAKRDNMMINMSSSSSSSSSSPAMMMSINDGSSSSTSSGMMPISYMPPPSISMHHHPSSSSSSRDHDPSSSSTMQMSDE